MKKHEQQRAEKIFAAALAIADPAGRQAYVDRACVGDEQLRREVESLLAAAEDAGSFLQEPPSAVAKAALGVPPSGGLDVEPAQAGLKPAKAGTPNPPRQIELLARKEDQIITRRVLGCGDYVVGRSSSCDVVIDSGEVSQRHARLLVLEQEIAIEDLGSSNGTFVEGRRIEPQQRVLLRVPQSVKLGSVTLELTSHTALPELEQTVAQGSSELGTEEALETARNYQLRELVGKGGMGVVYKAEDLSLKRPVAMKRLLLEGGLGGQEGRRRFLQEARVMGRLEHPNIVPIHELGLDAQGQVFYTMKLVKGATLQNVLDEIQDGKTETIAKYPLSQLLTIFQKVCDAVSFAHSQGVIHRDLKPSNIMLDDFGVVLVMDWGLAKILRPAGSIGDSPVVSGDPPDATEARQAELYESAASPSGSKPQEASETLGDARGPGVFGEGAEHNTRGACAPHSAGKPRNEGSAGGPPVLPGAVQTMEGRVMGSPNFMAPEQAAGRIQEMDERTDIYALGGILYSILTLRPPVMGPDLRAILELIRTGDIRPPTEYNHLVRHAEHGEKGRTSAPPFPHCPAGKVPAPLSAIAMKALATPPGDRYQSIAELQKDITAYQTGFVTLAEGASAWRVVRLWLARHRVTFAVLTFVIALFVIFAVVTANMWVELRGTAETFYDKATALVSVTRFQEALGPIDYAIRLDGKKAEYQFLRGNVLQALLNLEEAQRAYKAALELDPKHELAKLAAGNLKVCQELLRSASGQKELPDAALFTLSEAMLRQGRSVEASAVLGHLSKRGEAARRELYAALRARLDQAEIGGTLTVDDIGRVELNLENLPISDISALKGMPLNALDLDATKVTNLTALAGMPLDKLFISGLEVGDLTPLRGMPLSRLEMWDARVTDITPLAGMPLEELQLSTRVKDIRPLAGMGIRRLRGVSVNDLRTLRTLPLERIDFHGCDISDLRPLLEFFPQITTLELNDCRRVRDFTPLRQMDLHALSLNSTLVSDLSVLQHMPLSWLALNDTSVTNFSPLIGLELTTILLSNTKLADLNILKGMPLRTLWLDGCRNIRDLTPLKEFKQLEMLAIPSHIKDIDFLRQMPSLKRIGFRSDALEPTEEFWKKFDARKKRGA